MGYIDKNQVLGYIDHRLKSASKHESGSDELRMIASMIISTQDAKVREDESSEAYTTRINGKVVLHYCARCRSLLKAGDRFCNKCGRRLDWQEGD